MFKQNPLELNNIRSEFTIKDLENFSGIKAHTIRIWEKRYDLLHPNRTDSNIRFYDLENLQKLLNISLLYSKGMKISKIAKLDRAGMDVQIREVAFEGDVESQAMNSFKLAMLNFDEVLFNQTYNSLVAQTSFRDVFRNVFLPLMKDIGFLWQLDSITPAHEHFITNLIKQKIYINIEKLQFSQNRTSDKLFVLYLPMNEIHELGLLYLHFELLLYGHRSIYLGQSVPTKNLLDVKDLYKNVCYVTYLTVEPSEESVEDYLTEVKTKVLNGSGDTMWVFGYKLRGLNIQDSLGASVKLFENPEDVLKLL